METQIHTINYLNKEELLTQYLCESKEQFEERKELLKKLEKDNVPWKESYKLSKIFYSVKYKKCRYQPMVYHMIKKYL